MLTFQRKHEARNGAKMKFDLFNNNRIIKLYNSGG